MVKLLTLLDHYRPSDPHEAVAAGRVVEFLKSDPRCFERSNPVGHITGSAWVVDPSGTKVLLTHHKKLGKWLQVGGHADGEKNILAVALREAREETGIEQLTPVSTEIFDVDIHRIPARSPDPEHDHYDIRFALRSAQTEFKVSDESHALAWVDIAHMSEMTNEESMLRMARKWTRRQEKNKA